MSFVTWMYQIARNARFDHFRRRRPEVGFEAGGLEAASEAPSPAEALQAREEAALIRQALGRLPHEKREVLVLSRFQNLKYEQIAQILNCEPGTVKVRVYRALRDLRQIYSELVKEEAS